MKVDNARHKLSFELFGLLEHAATQKHINISARKQRRANNHTTSISSLAASILTSPVRYIHILFYSSSLSHFVPSIRYLLLFMFCCCNSESSSTSPLLQFAIHGVKVVCFCSIVASFSVIFSSSWLGRTATSFFLFSWLRLFSLPTFDPTSPKS